jgi:peroxiredoxin
VLRAYGVWHRIGFDAYNIARPALFLIGHDGVIRYAFVSGQQDEFPGFEEIARAIAELRRGTQGAGRRAPGAGAPAVS